jgi:hypothetical protein
MPDINKPAVPPDPATNYERAQPEKESPGGKLVEPPPPPDAHPDQLRRDDPDPAKPKHPVGPRRP